MGIQLHVELKDLPEDFKQEIVKVNRVDYSCYRNYCHRCDGLGCLIEEDLLLVHFPKNGTVRSYATDSLVFDNKNVNHQFRQELEERGVPFVRS